MYILARTALLRFRELLARSHLEVTRAKCACAVRMQTYVALFFTAFRALADPCESIIWCFTSAARNFYQPVLAKIYRDYAFLFMT